MPLAEQQLQLDFSAITVTVIEPPAKLFTVIELEQGTPAWLEWRQSGIGASDAPTIMNENPWKTAKDLLKEKRGGLRDFTPNAAMARGTQLEPIARSRYVSRTGRDVRPACLQSHKHSWMLASLDGITPDHSAIVEIKCGESVYRKTAQTRSVPSYYYGQLQHILAVTGLAGLDFWCYLPDRPEVLLSVARNDGYIARLIETERAFWDSVQSPA